MIDVHKFGGSSQTEYGYNVIKSMILNEKLKKRIIVVSAISDVTNLLIDYIKNPNSNSLNIIKNINREFANELNINIIDLIEYFENLASNPLENSKKIVGYGEYFTCNILSRYLEKNNINNFVIENTEIISSNKKNILENLYNNGEFQVNSSIIKKCLDNVDTIIIPGFGGVDIDGEFCLMGRGGSDTTGSIIASEIISQ